MDGVPGAEAGAAGLTEGGTAGGVACGPPATTGGEEEGGSPCPSPIETVGVVVAWVGDAACVPGREDVAPVCGFVRADGGSGGTAAFGFNLNFDAESAALGGGAETGVAGLAGAAVAATGVPVGGGGLSAEGGGSVMKSTGGGGGGGASVFACITSSTLEETEGAVCGAPFPTEGALIGLDVPDLADVSSVVADSCERRGLRRGRASAVWEGGAESCGAFAGGVGAPSDPVSVEDFGRSFRRIGASVVASVALELTGALPDAPLPSAS